MIKDPIKKAKNGTYYFRANIGYDLNGKKIQKRASGFKNKKEAKEAYLKFITLKPEHFEQNEHSIKFREYLHQIFLPWYKTQVKESTYINRLQAVKKHLAYFHKFALNEIKPIHVQKWQLQLSAKYSNNYIRVLQTMLSLALNRAIILGLAKENPSKIVGNVKKVKPVVDFWTKEEFESVIAFIYKEDYFQHYLFVALCLLFMTGLRYGEAAALLWDDIDFEEQTIKITKSLYYRNSRNYRFVDPKTKASIRTLALDGDTLALLQEWKSTQRNVIKTDFILSYNGIPLQKNLLPRAIKRYAKLAHVHYICVHALRHSHASLLINIGENPLVVKDRLGHDDVKTTLETYGHLYPNSNREVAKRLTGCLQITTASQNHDVSSLNQFTIGHSKKAWQKSAIKSATPLENSQQTP